MSQPSIARLKQRIRLAVAVLLLSVMALSIWKGVTEYRQIIADAERTTAGFAKALSEHAESALAESDRVLKDIIHDISRRGPVGSIGERDLFELITRQSVGSPQIGMVFLVDRSGRLYLNSTGLTSKDVDVADREYFNQYLFHPETDLYLSNPLVSRLAGRWRFNLVRPIRDSKGRIENLAAVAFNTDYFRGFFTKESLGSKGRILLIRTDGIPLVNEPQTAEGYQTDFSSSPLFREFLPQKPSGTFLMKHVLVHPEPRIVSYHKLPRFPVVAVVSLSRDELLQAWYPRIIPYIAIITVLCLSALLLVRILFKHLDSLYDAQQFLAEQKQKLAIRLKILEKIATGTDLIELLNNIVEMVEKENKGAICSVLMVDDSGDRLKHCVAPNLPEVYNQSVDGLRIGPGMGSCGTAAHTRQRVVVEDISTHPFWKGFKPAFEAGLCACWSEPIFSPNHELMGTFAIYYKEPRSPQPVEIELIESAAHLAGIAIGSYSEEKLRRKLEEQLLHIQKIEAIGQLAGGMAHDFNNLLTPILVYAGMLNHVLANDANKNKVEGILTAANKAKELTQKLLSFGRKQKLNIRNHDLNEIVHSIQDIIQRTIRENITIQTNLSKEAAQISADRGQIEQILLNLAINSQDAIDGPGTISIETGHVLLDNEFTRIHPGMHPGAYILLAFRDTGCGMTTDVQRHIFEPFFTTKPVGHGTGLGLATTYGIIKQHNGYIAVTSEIGTGSTFSIYLPTDSQVVQSADQELDKPAAASDWNAVEGKTVLVVEDNEMVRNMTQELLENSGYQVILAESPSIALQLAADNNHRIDLLVSDVIMPEMNGYDMYNRLTELRPGLPVLFISGYMRDIILKNDSSEEEFDFLQKPFTAEQLIERVNRLSGSD